MADIDRPNLDEGDLDHLSRALRVRPGERVTAGDGSGRWRVCRFTAPGGLEPDGPVQVEPAAQPAVTVALSIVKGDRTTWAVQKLVEVGVDRVVLLSAARTVVHWDSAKATRELQRLRRIAREAAMQSRRAWLADIAGPESPEALLGSGGVSMADPGGPPVTLEHPTVLVGPEGGWAPEELALGAPRAGLGPTTLRTETAAVVAGTLLTALRAGLVCPFSPG